LQTCHALLKQRVAHQRYVQGSHSTAAKGQQQKRRQLVSVGCGVCVSLCTCAILYWGNAHQQATQKQRTSPPPDGIDSARPHDRTAEALGQGWLLILPNPPFGMTRAPVCITLCITHREVGFTPCAALRLANTLGLRPNTPRCGAAQTDALAHVPPCTRAC
jgi:hypothetical protein